MDADAPIVRFADVAHRTLPFTLAGALVCLTLLLPPHPAGWGPLAFAGALLATLIVVPLLLPWRRLPRWSWAAPAFAAFAMIAVGRHAAGGTSAGLSALMLLPVVWLALHGSSRQLALGLGCMTLALFAPLALFGTPTYAPEEWRRAITLLIVGAAVSVVVQRLVAESRGRAREIGEHARTLETVAHAIRRLGTAADARPGICEAAVRLADADFGCLMEPDGPAHLTLTAAAGVELDTFRLGLRSESSGSLVAYTSGERFFVPDAAATPAISRRLREATGAASVLFEPVRRGDEVAAVLVLAWRRPVAALSARETLGIALLADEVGAVLERADLLAQVEALSRTDALTGLPNRREWEPRLDQEIARATRDGSDLTVALLDFDHFKRFNDSHGHQAGDRLLKAAAAEWRTRLREVDMLGRYGGEEFVVILPGCPGQYSPAVLDRLREAMPDGQSCSVGAARWAPGETAEQVLARADASLYQAKQSGRDRVVLG